MKNEKVSRIKIGPIVRTKVVRYDPNNYEKTRMTGVVYGKKDQKIKKEKVVVYNNTKTNNTRAKIVEYGPVSYYGTQSSKKSIFKNGVLKRTK
jgi:hypothetical protein